MKKYLVIGGDERQKRLAEFYGVECRGEGDKRLKRQIKKSDIIIIPLGNISENLAGLLRKYVKKNTIVIGGDFVLERGRAINLMKNEELSITTVEMSSKDPVLLSKRFF